jgi:hypothetical protein
MKPQSQYIAPRLAGFGPGTVGRDRLPVFCAVIGLGGAKIDCTIIVLGVSDEQFKGHYLNFNCYVHEDLGYTEVLPGTRTCLAYYEER